MAWFTHDFNRFFKDLAAHNDRDWFNANKARYEEVVKRPFEAFIGEVIHEVSALDPSMRITPKEAIFRIHRDTRFSRDKTPYKLQASAIISPAGRNDVDSPGMYLELGPEAVRIYGGRYMPQREALHALRLHIAGHLKRFRSLYGDAEFVAHFGTIRGERNKVVPAELKAAALQEPLIANKQFYFMAELPPSLVSKPELLLRVMEHYRVMRPMNRFLSGS